MNYLDYFREICSIPHVSHHTGGISDYLVAFADSNGLESFRDDSGNVVIRKKAAGFRRNRQSPVILQAHMDMVGVCTDGRDMTREPIRPIFEGDIISADASSLGADNGIGMSYILDILADKKLKSPEIEAVFTADEEDGMEGVRNFDFSKLNASFVINLDSECEDEVCVSSAGGMNEEIRIGFNDGFYRLESGVLSEITIFGLKGGHSGNQIHKRRANAIICLVRLLRELSLRHDIRFVSISGGSARNVIPSRASASVLYCGFDFESFRKDFKETLADLRKKHLKSDPDFDAEVVWRKDSKVKSLSSMNSKLFEMLSSLPDGLMESDADGNAVTSLNFGMADFNKEEKVLTFKALVRSNIDSHRNELADKVRLVFEGDNSLKSPVSAFSYVVNTDQEYGAWQRREKSALLDFFLKTHKRKLDKNPKVTSTHGGLECGYFSQGIKDCDLISIGPDISDVHSVKEKAFASSCERIMGVLKAMLENWEL